MQAAHLRSASGFRSCDPENCEVGFASVQMEHELVLFRTNSHAGASACSAKIGAATEAADTVDAIEAADATDATEEASEARRLWAWPGCSPSSVHTNLAAAAVAAVATGVAAGMVRTGVS